MHIYICNLYICRMPFNCVGSVWFYISSLVNCPYVGVDALLCYAGANPTTCEITNVYNASVVVSFFPKRTRLLAAL
jgi:hypothetical protein